MLLQESVAKTTLRTGLEDTAKFLKRRNEIPKPDSILQALQQNLEAFQKSAAKAAEDKDGARARRMVRHVTVKSRITCN